MSSSMNTLTMPVVILMALSIVLSIAISVVSAMSGVSHFSTTAWFTCAVALGTLLFHGVILAIVFRRSKRPADVSYLVEKGLVYVPAFNADKEVFCTAPIMSCFGILFAMWVVAVGAFLFEVVLRPVATRLDKANAAIMTVETLLMAAQAIRAYVRSNAIKATDAAARRIKRFTTGELPRPLVLQRSLSKDSISCPSAPPAILSEKIAPVSFMCSPPALPASALRPEPRFNGARSLVLVDSRLESNVSYHGSMSASSSGSFHTVA